MRIIIDKRERELSSRTHEALLKLPEDIRNRIEIVSQDMPIGDILIQTDDTKTLLIIERKTFPDLLASIKDGRYEEQSHRLANTSDVPRHSIIYLLEGMFSSLSDPSQKKVIFSAMTSIHFFKGFSVMRTSSTYETGEWLVATAAKLAKELARGKVGYHTLSLQTEAVDESLIPRELKEDGANYCNFVKKVKKENVTPENIGEIVLSQIPGISAVTAIAIMKKFSTFPRLIDALKENPQCLDDITTESNGKARKISKSCIENIKLYFTH